MVPIKSLYVVSGSTRLKPSKNTMVCMAIILSSNGGSSAYFDNIRLKLSKYAYFETRKIVRSKYLFRAFNI